MYTEKKKKRISHCEKDFWITVANNALFFTVKNCNNSQCTTCQPVKLPLDGYFLKNAPPLRPCSHQSQQRLLLNISNLNLSKNLHSKKNPTKWQQLRFPNPYFMKTPYSWLPFSNFIHPTLFDPLFQILSTPLFLFLWLNGSFCHIWCVILLNERGAEVKLRTFSLNNPFPS